MSQGTEESGTFCTTGCSILCSTKLFGKHLKLQIQRVTISQAHLRKEINCNAYTSHQQFRTVVWGIGIVTALSGGFWSTAKCRGSMSESCIGRFPCAHQTVSGSSILEHHLLRPQVALVVAPRASDWCSRMGWTA